MATLGIHVSFQGWYLSKGMGDLHYLSPIDEEATASPQVAAVLYISGCTKTSREILEPKTWKLVSLLEFWEGFSGR